MFGFKKPVAQRVVITSAFKDYLENLDDNQGRWITRYIKDDGSIDDERAFEDMQIEGVHISAYDMPMFRSLVADKFSEYLGVEVQTMPMPDVRLLVMLDHIPENITIRRVRPKASGNTWCVQYLKGRRYYGKTLQQAIGILLDRNANARKKYQDSFSTSVKSVDVRGSATEAAMKIAVSNDLAAAALFGGIDVASDKKAEVKSGE